MILLTALINFTGCDETRNNPNIYECTNQFNIIPLGGYDVYMYTENDWDNITNVGFLEVTAMDDYVVHVLIPKQDVPWYRFTRLIDETTYKEAYDIILNISLCVVNGDTILYFNDADRGLKLKKVR